MQSKIYAVTSFFDLNQETRLVAGTLDSVFLVVFDCVTWMGCCLLAAFATLVIFLTAFFMTFSLCVYFSAFASSVI